MRNPMVEYDEAMTLLAFDDCRERLVLDPVGLDYGGIVPVSFADGLDGLDGLDGVVGPAGHNAGTVRRLYADTLAPAVVAVDRLRRHRRPGRDGRGG